jgi:hypothetical protein
MAGCSAQPRETARYSPGRLEPPNGIYFGVNLDWRQDSAAAFNGRLGLRAAVYVAFFTFPFSSADLSNVDKFIEQVAQEHGLALITLEPSDGLNTITAGVAVDLAERIAGYNRQGVPIFVRFAHEMNGSWYPWSQRPAEYVEAFRKIAEAIHSRAPLTAMLWAPNYGGGYPFAGGQYEALPGSTNFQPLDTNHDGHLDMLDDMYEPYYPGDDFVDWVGMSVYHWGNEHPWGENEIPEVDSFIARITGTYSGMDGNQQAVPDFYQVYVEQHQKPMAITETAALYNPAVGGDSERLIKQTWWRQVFNPNVAIDFPGIKMINWFEWRKFEIEIGGIIDWTVSSKPELAQAFVEDLPRSHLLFAADIPSFR